MSIEKHNLTTPQQNIYNETKFYTGTALGNIGGTIEFQIDGLTSEIIEKAINLLIDAAEGLRLRITEEGGEVCQYVADHEYESIPVIDARELTQEQIDQLNDTLPPYKAIAKVTIRNTEFVKTTTKKIKRIYKK